MKMSDFYSPELLEAVSKNPVIVSEDEPIHGEPLTEGKVTVLAGVENEEIKNLLNSLRDIEKSLDKWFGLSKGQGAVTPHISVASLVSWITTIHKTIKVIESEWL